MKKYNIYIHSKNIYIFFIFLSLSIFFFSTEELRAKPFHIKNIEVSKPFMLNFDKNEVINEGFKKAYFELISLIVNSSEQKKFKITKLSEINGDITSPKTTKPPDINKTISIKSKSKGLYSFQPIFLKVIKVHIVFKIRIEPVNIVNNGINLIANILKSILLENDFVISELSSKSNVLLKI